MGMSISRRDNDNMNDDFDFEKLEFYRLTSASPQNNYRLLTAAVKNRDNFCDCFWSSEIGVEYGLDLALKKNSSDSKSSFHEACDEVKEILHEQGVDAAVGRLKKLSEEFSLDLGYRFCHEAFKKVKEDSSKGGFHRCQDEAFRAYVSLVEEAMDRYENLRNVIVENNLPLIQYVLRRCFGAKRRDWDELWSYGAEGLIESIDRFDSSKGDCLSTYATQRIWQKVKRGISDRRIVHLPDKAFAAVWNARCELEQMHGRTPSVEEIADYTHKKVSVVSRILPLINAPLSVGIRDFDEEGASKRCYAYEPAVEADPGERLEREEEIVLILKNLAQFSERDRDVVERHIRGDASFKELGKKHGVSGECARQTYKRTVAKIRKKCAV